MAARRKPDGVFDADDAEAVAKGQAALGLGPNGKVDVPLLDVLLRRAGPGAGRRDALIHLVIDHANLDVSSALAVAYVPSLPQASDVDPFPGGVSTIQIGDTAFASYRVMVAEIGTSLRWRRPHPL